MNKVIAAIVAVGMMAALVAGCGSSSSSTSTGASEAELSTTEFVHQGNAICQAGNKVLNKAASKTFTGGQPTDQQVQAFADVAVPSIQGQIDDIRALNPPADLDAKVSDFLDQAQTALDKVKKDPSLFQGQPFADVNKTAKGIGLTECAS
jgi:hypothetical protein